MRNTFRSIPQPLVHMLHKDSSVDDFVKEATLTVAPATLKYPGILATNSHARFDEGIEMMLDSQRTPVLWHLLNRCDHRHRAKLVLLLAPDFDVLLMSTG